VESSQLEKPFPGRGCCSSPVVQWVGYVGDRLDHCDAPQFSFCVTCGASGVAACGATRRSRCVPCATRYRGRVGRIAETGVLLVPDGAAVMVTLTAPGDHVHKAPSGDLCGCTGPEGVDLPSWNASFTVRANRFLEAVRRGEASPMVRGRRAKLDVQYFCAREGQRRGALHGHWVVRRTDGKPLQLKTVDVRSLAIRHGFGHSVDVRRVGTSKHGGSKSRTARGAAFYVSKYVSKTADGRDEIRWPAAEQKEGVPYRRAVWRGRTWTCSRGWGSSMAEQRALARARACGAASPEGEATTAPHGAALDPLMGVYARGSPQIPPEGRDIEALRRIFPGAVVAKGV